MSGPGQNSAMLHFGETEKSSIEDKNENVNRPQ